jgi:hypothetical protein
MCLGLEHPLKNLLGHMLLKSHFCLGDYPYPLLLHVKIRLLSSASMKGNFECDISSQVNSWHSRITN